MGFVSVLGFAHKLVSERLKSGDCAIDATVGGGNDTLHLSKCVGATGHVIGFDIQGEALDVAKAKLERDRVGQVRLFLDSHERMAYYIPEGKHGKIGAVMFNLGYLPSGDESVITTAKSTIPALEAALRLIRVGGIVTIVVYPGHEGGDIEAAEVAAWSERLPQREYQVLSYKFTNRKESAPYLIAVEKTQGEKLR